MEPDATIRINKQRDEQDEEREEYLDQNAESPEFDFGRTRRRHPGAGTERRGSTIPEIYAAVHDKRAEGKR